MAFAGLNLCGLAELGLDVSNPAVKSPLALGVLGRAKNRFSPARLAANG